MEDIFINQFVTSAVAGKMTALMTEEYQVISDLGEVLSFPEREISYSRCASAIGILCVQPLSPEGRCNIINGI